MIHYRKVRWSAAVKVRPFGTLLRKPWRSLIFKTGKSSVCIFGRSYRKPKLHPSWASPLALSKAGSIMPSAASNPIILIRLPTRKEIPQ